SPIHTLRDNDVILGTQSIFLFRVPLGLASKPSALPVRNGTSDRLFGSLDSIAIVVFILHTVALLAEPILAPASVFGRVPRGLRPRRAGRGGEVQLGDGRAGRRAGDGGRQGYLLAPRQGRRRQGCRPRHVHPMVGHDPSSPAFLISIPRCGPCKVMAPKFLGLSEKYLDVAFMKLDCNKENRAC
ncbi:hypothetical protein BHE74_00009954, partial [Ensete ventricosum]